MGNVSRKLTPSNTTHGPPVLDDETQRDADYLDPRSPTPDVTRTPITNTEALKNKITKNIDLSKTFDKPREEKLVYNNPLLSAVIRKHLHWFDPRSPTLEFERTPINLSCDQNNKLWTDCIDSGKTCKEDQPQTLEVVPRNLSEEFFDSTLESTLKDSEPLGSSTASQDAIEMAAYSMALLETNFDYVPDQNIAKSDEENIMKKNNLPMVNALQKLKLSDKDPRSPSQGIERTPIVLPQRVSVIPKDELVEDMSEELLVATLQSDIADFRRTPAVPVDQGLLIYEDDCTKDVTPRKVKSAGAGTRTPLSCMNNKSDRSKSTTDIGVRKKMASRIPKRVSGFPKIESKECAEEYENTPPAHHAQVWDNDSSVVL